MNSDSEHVPRHGRATLLSGVVGMLLYLIVGWLYVASGLVVPAPWYLVMWVLWVGGLFILARVFRRRPAWTPAVPIGAVILWVGVVQIGDWLLGWTA